MSTPPVYLDSSAIAKLVLPEPESEALRTALTQWSRRVTSVIAGVEVQRAVRRASNNPALLARAQQVVNDLELVALGPRVIRNAGMVGPVDLRSLDAIHLASALLMGMDLGAVVTYDDRLAAAARGAGVSVVQPR